MKKKYSEHHIIPLSLWWIDNEANKERMFDPDHIFLHQKQNLHHWVVRKLRKKVNNILIRTPSKLWILHWVQRKFFEWIVDVPDRIILPQTNWLTKLIRLKEYEIKSILWQIWEWETYHVDDWRKNPPIQWNRNELIDENKQKLEKLFELERERAKRWLEYIQKAYVLA